MISGIVPYFAPGFSAQPDFEWSRCSSFSLVTKLCAGRLGMDSRQGQGSFLIATVSWPGLLFTQPPVQWAPGPLSPGREADHSPPSSAEIKIASSYISTPHTSLWGGTYISTGYVFMAWYLVKYRTTLSLPLLQFWKVELKDLLFPVRHHDELLN